MSHYQRMALSKNKIREMLIQDLGGGDIENSATVEVELNDQNFENVIKRAQMWFNHRKGFVVFRPMSIVEGQTEYKMRDDVDNILSVSFNVPSDVAAFYSLGFFDIIPYGPQNIGGIGGGVSDYSGFAQLLQYQESRKRVFSVEPDWFYEQQTKTLYVTYRSGSFAQLMLIKAKLDTWDLAKLPAKDQDLFYRWCLAHSKEIVGRIRSKYDSLPAAGGTVTLDGATLIAESKEEKIQLDKEVLASQGPDGLLVG